MADIELKCACGTVRGVATDIGPKTGNRLVCYCESCRAFAEHLGGDDLLDDWGGSDIFQCTPSQMTLTEGADQVRCLRLTPKGLHRWYTACCRTPVGNTLTAGWAFVGVSTAFMAVADRDATLGPVKGYSWTKTALDGLPDAHRAKTLGPLSLAGMMWRLARWRMSGKQRPSPFFTDDGTPVVEPEILNP